MSILDKIYWELYLENPPETTEYKEAKERCYAAWDEAIEVLSPELSNKVWDNFVEFDTIKSLYQFKEGFRLGVQLMSEARTLPGEP